MRLMLVGLTEYQARTQFDAVADLAERGGSLLDAGLLEQAVRDKQPDVVAIHLGVRPTAVLKLITRVRALVPGVSWLAITDATNGELVQQVTEAGCADLVVLRECPEDLRRALRTLNHRDRPPTADGQAIAVLGAKGGVGTSMVAVNLADALAQKSRARVILVDLHVYLGDLAVALDIRPRPSALWFLGRSAVVDARTWNEAPPLHSAGFRVLALDGDMSRVGPITADEVVTFVEKLKERYDQVVLDCGAGINEVSLAACSAADQRLLVLTDDLGARTGARRRLEVLKELDLGPVPARGVLNRAEANPEDLLAAVERDTGLPMPVAITNAWKDVQTAYQMGKTLRQSAPKAPITQDFRELLEVVAGEGYQTERRNRAFFTFFR